MLNNELLGKFLRKRRERLRPEDVGLPGSSRRRVAGLRREEVAMLAGLSVDYYGQIERGETAMISPEILTTLGKALRLNPEETLYLRKISAPDFFAHESFETEPEPIRPSLQAVLDASTLPTRIRDYCITEVGSNRAARALYQPLFENPIAKNNMALFTFLCPEAKDFFLDWDVIARGLTATLRMNYAVSDKKSVIFDFVKKLKEDSPEFKELWEDQDVLNHSSGYKDLNHPVLGRIELDYEGMALASPSDWIMYTYVPRPGYEDKVAALNTL
ncbi:MAG: helix-turn-helix transcriptional regulator [Corynebacterium sp.]|nr:helix-turn-helix transcriptional regulator [Corynebacterium sp.]